MSDASALVHPASAPATAVDGALLTDRALLVALLLSALFHVFLLSIHFGFPERQPSAEHNRSLNVVLVNARHERAPEDATALAQANLDGGGTTDQDVSPTTPVPAQEASQDGDTLVDAQAAAPEPAPVRQDVIARPPEPERPTPAVRPQPEPPAPATDTEPTQVSGLDLMSGISAAARLEAEIDRRLNEYAQRPRKQYIGARTREHRFAQYLEDWRQKVERVGTLNYPDTARGRIYGSLLLSVVIRADGSIESVDIQRSSGHQVLDQAAIRIVELAAPFAPFPPDIRVDTDIIDITRTWTFTNSDQLRTR